jgi:hypothetical protein
MLGHNLNRWRCIILIESGPRWLRKILNGIMNSTTTIIMRKDKMISMRRLKALTGEARGRIPKKRVLQQRDLSLQLVW